MPAGDVGWEFAGRPGFYTGADDLLVVVRRWAKVAGPLELPLCLLKLRLEVVNRLVVGEPR